MIHELILLQWSFIHPGFAIAGIVCGSVPVIIHLINRNRYREVPWAAMQFLLAARKKSTRKLKLENWILLLLRVCLILLFFSAIARPMINSGGANLFGESNTIHILCIDNSASMSTIANNQSRFQSIKTIASDIINSISI